MKKLILGLCLGLLLGTDFQDENKNDTRVEVLAKTSLSWDGGPLPDYSKGRPEITIVRIKIPAGMQLKAHKHQVINAGVLLEGELTVVTEENKRLHLKAGESIVEVVNKWHYGKNEGDKPAEILVFYAGIVDTAITVYE